MSTLFRSAVEPPNIDMTTSTRGSSELAVAKATLIPNNTTLPIGMIIPTPGDVPQPQSSLRTTPPIQRYISESPPVPARDSTVIPLAQEAAHAQPLDPIVSDSPETLQTKPSAPAVQPVSSQASSGESLISDADWKRLKAVMKGHQEKLARDKESPEYIQRQQEKAEQEAAKKKAAAESKRRQDLARAGKFPKAKVVYLSPEEHASSPIADTNERKVPEQPSVSQISEGPEAIELPEVAAGTGELTTGDAISQEPAPVQKSDEMTHPKPVSAKRQVQLTPGADAPPAAEPASEPKAGVGDQSKTKALAREDRRIRPEQEAAAGDRIQPEPEHQTGEQIQPKPEAPVDQPFDHIEEAPEEEFYQPQGQREIEPTPVAEQESKDTVEEVPFVESTPDFDTPKPEDTPAAEMFQLEPEAAVQPPSREPKPPAQTDGEPKTEEKTTFGQRLLDAARSLFRRQDEPAPTQEPTVSLAADEKISREEVKEEISEHPSVEMPPDTEDIQIPGRPFEIREQESKPQDASIPTPGEKPAQPVVQRSEDQPGIEIAESSVTREPSTTERGEDEYADELAGEPPLVSESEVASEDVSQAGQPVDMPQEAMHPAAEEKTFESPVEKPEPAAKIEPESSSPTISRKTDSAQAEEHQGKPAGIQQKPEVATSMPQAPQTEIETAKIVRDDSSREPDMGIPAPVTTASSDVEDVDPRETVISEGFGPEPDQADDIFEDESSRGIGPSAAADSDAGDSAIQKQPLQEVWPAREATPSPPSVIAAMSSEETEDPSSPIDEGDLPTLVFQDPVEEGDGNEAELRSTLQGVTPGKPTDSSIELLPPRRPRPQIAPVRRSEDVKAEETSSTPARRQEEKQVTPEQRQTPEIPKTTALDSSTESLQGHEEERQSQPPAEVSDQPIRPHTEEPISQKPREIPDRPVQRREDELVSRKQSEIVDQSIQQHEEEPLSRKPSDAVDRPEVVAPPDFRPEQPPSRSPDPGFVQTGIGALPRDLWDYLGETTPDIPATDRTGSADEMPIVKAKMISPVSPAPASPPLQTFTDPPATDLALDTVQRTETRSETSTPVLDFQTPLQPLGLESALDWTQSRGETVESPTETESAVDQDEDAGQSGADIEDLARKILPIIKRKLSIERERSRGRF